MHTHLTAVQLLSPAAREDMLAGALVYIGMPGKAARAFGLADDMVGPFGKPWACLRDPRGWLVAYREYLWASIRADADFALAVRDLHGKTLVCWCKAKGADTRCHGEVLMNAAEWLYHGIEAMGDGPIPPGAEGGPVAWRSELSCWGAGPGLCSPDMPCPSCYRELSA